MASVKTLSVLALSSFFVFALGSMAHAEDAKPPAIQVPREMMQGELGKRVPDMLKGMTPEEQKAFIEKFQARLKEARAMMNAMTPAEHQRNKELREKIQKMTPEERWNFRDDPTKKKNVKDGPDNKPLPVPEAPPEPGSMMPKH